MFVSALLIVAALQSIPAEYVLDCGVARIPAGTKLRVRFEARDGSTYEFCHEADVADADPASFNDIVMAAVDEPGCAWRGQLRRPDERTVIVSGTKKSPIKSVTIESSTGWKPTVRWVPLPLSKK